MLEWTFSTYKFHFGPIQAHRLVTHQKRMSLVRTHINFVLVNVNVNVMMMMMMMMADDDDDVDAFALQIKHSKKFHLHTLT